MQFDQTILMFSGIILFMIVTLFLIILPFHRRYCYMVLYFRVGTEEEIEEMENAIESGDFELVKSLIKKVLDVELH